MITRITALCALFTLVCCVDVTPVDDIRVKFYALEYELWKNVTDPHWGVSGLGGDIELSKAFTAFGKEIEALPTTPRPPLENWLWNKALEKIQLIEGHYKNFLEFVNHQATPGIVPAPVREWLDTAENILLDPTSSVSKAVTKLDLLLQHGDMFRSALQEDGVNHCETQLSPHQLIYDMYNTISLTEIKGYAMMQFSWMLLRIYGKGNFTQEAKLTRQRYSERTSETAAAARAALAMARRDLYRCDPSQQIEGKTYEQVTRLLQGYVENEVDMNPDNTCKDNCAAYTLTKNYGCYKDQYCSNQRKCAGRIIDCQYVDSDMWICPASETSNRRYEWIAYENGRNLGKAGSCKRGSTKVDSWWRWLFWHCSYCMCLCDDATNSDRYFSLREATSDDKNNKVVTGVRIVKLGRVFHLQIAEGILGEKGQVVPGSWVPVQPFEPEEHGVREGVDYHMLTYEKRAIDLDELDSPSGSVLTGIRFGMVGVHLHFEIRSTPFNYTTGRLYPERSQWISNDNTEGADKPRSRLELHKPDIPTHAHNPFPVDSKHDQYLEFTHSDFDADAAQSTVPFIDIQPIMPMKGESLLSGAGIIHRGYTGYGGYLALKVFTYDYTSHVKAYPPQEQFEEDVDTTEFSSIVN